MSQHIALEKKKLYCSYCEGSPVIDIPRKVNLALPVRNEFVENVKCTICKNIGYVKWTI